ncbi:hypothetical protein T484DRAFT_1896356 [Baffinella frigidus]|nr:hypothetical protein T484DRAFT_1896356 [Cryptophyta sp. CCMP2293]
MSGIRQKVLKGFKLRGLGPDKEAIRLLCEHLETCSDSDKELNRCVECIRSSPSLIKTRVTAELVEEAISSQAGEADADVQEFVMILDHKNVPISIYDPVRKVFERKQGDSRALVGGQPMTRIQAFRERFDIIEQRIARNRHFAKTAFGDTAMIELTRISGVRRSKERVFVLGMLTQPVEGKFFLEDMSHSIPIDLSDASAKHGLFAENCIVVVAGEMDRDVFKVHTLALPPVESRRDTCEMFPPLAVPTFRKPYSADEKRVLAEEEMKEDHTQIVVLSDVWLDRAKVINGLRMMFFRYDALCKDGVETGTEYRFLFVLMGNFCSQPYTRGTATHRALFDELGALIASFASLAECATWIFVPGPNDVLGGNSQMLPRSPLPSQVSAGFLEKVPSASFCSDPCRIKFYSQVMALPQSG